jgi:hypothetical protein
MYGAWFSNDGELVAGACGWAYECPKYVEQFIRATKHQVNSSWFFLLHIYTIKILHAIISRPVFIHSSFCVWNFILLAGRPNSVEVARDVYKVQKVSYALS